MTNRQPTGANAPTGNHSGEDELTRLVRLIARQAAHEALRAFTDSLETRTGHPRAPFDPPIQPEGESRGTAREVGPPPEPGERWLSVAAVAARLGISERWVRRKIARGELPAHRVGRLLRVGERALAAYVARAASRRMRTSLMSPGSRNV
jgi:excisionase family DNA binding protein